MCEEYKDEEFTFSCLRCNDGTVEEHMDEEAEIVLWKCNNCSYVYTCEDDNDTKKSNG